MEVWRGEPTWPRSWGSKSWCQDSYAGSVGFQDYSLFSTPSSLSGLSIPRAGTRVHHTGKYLESFCRGFYLKTDGPHFSNILYLTRMLLGEKPDSGIWSIPTGASAGEPGVGKTLSSNALRVSAGPGGPQLKKERNRGENNKRSSSYPFPGHPLPCHCTPDTLNRKFPHQGCHFETPPLVHGQNICVPPSPPTSIHCLS